MSEKLTVGELVYKISGDMDNLRAELKRSDTEVKNLKASLEKAGGATDKFGGKTESVATSVFKGTLAYGAFTKALQYAVGYIKLSINEASKLSESVNAVNVVFGSGAAKILEYGKSAATSVGLARSEYNQLATVTGALLKDTGLTMDQVAEQTNNLVIRASDMASVFNTSVPDALSALNQALRGETEAIRRYAGDVTDASLQTYLYSKGIKRNVTDLTEQEKRLYRVELIMKQTDVTAGDFANTSDSLANQQRILTSRFKDGAANLGRAFLPAIGSVIGAFVKTEKNTKDNSASFKSFAKVVYQVSQIVIVLGATLSNLAAVVKIAWNGVQVAFKGGATAILSGMKLVKQGLGQDTAEIESAIAGLAESALTDGADVADAFKQMGENSDTIKTALEQAFNPTNFKAIEDTAVAVDDLGAASEGTAPAVADAGKEVEDFTDKLLSLRDEAVKTREELEGELAQAFKEFGTNAKENVTEGITTLSQAVIGAEAKIKELKASLKEDGVDGDDRKRINKEIKAQQEILNSRKGFEERQAEVISGIRTKLEAAGLDAAKAGLDELLNVRSLEEQIAEDRRIASLDEFKRLEEENVRKLTALTDAFILEGTLLQDKITKQKAYEEDLTAFLVSEDAKRLANTEAWAAATMTKYGQLASQLKSLISMQNQLNSLKGLTGNLTSSKSTPASTKTTTTTTNNNKTVNAPISISTTLQGGSDLKTIGNELAWQLGQR